MPTCNTQRLKQAIRAATDTARRAIEAKARAMGTPIRRTRVSNDAVVAKTKEKWQARRETVKPFDKRLVKMLRKRGINVGSTPIKDLMVKALNELNLTSVEGSPSRQNIMDWIHEVPEQAAERAHRAREAFTRAHDDMLQNIEDQNVGHPGDASFLKAKQMIQDHKDEIESILDWAGMLATNNYDDLAKIAPKWALLSAEYENALGEEGVKILQDAYEALSQKFISNQFGRLTESFSSRLVRTKTPLAAWMAQNILEMPAGTGGRIERNKTAAIMAKIFEADVTVPMNKAWYEMASKAAKEHGYGRIKRLMLRMGSAHSSKDVQELSRQVMLEVNRRQMQAHEMTTHAPDYVREFVDKLEEANRKLYTLQYENKVEGITGWNQMRNYMKQSWNDGAFHDLMRDPDVGRDGLIDLIKTGVYRRVNDDAVMPEDVARDFAEAILETKLNRMNRKPVDSFSLDADRVSSSMDSIDEIIKHMNTKNRQASIEKVMEWVKSDNIGAAGYTHKRYIKLDYSATINANGRQISIMDLLDDDVIGNFNRYAKEASGRSAISKASGYRLNSEAAMDEFINAMGAQAAELGTFVNTKDVRNVFRQMLGLPFDGQLPIDVRKIRDAVALAGMNGLGESQLAEFGLASNRGLAGLFALHQLAQKGAAKFNAKWRPMKLTQEQLNSKQYLDELQQFSALYEDAHVMARNNVHFDTREPQMAQNAMNKAIEAGTGGKWRAPLQYIQTRYTGYAAIRQMQEQVAMAGLMNDALKYVRGQANFTSTARFKDIGLDLELLSRKLHDGTIVIQDGRVKTINMHRWTADERLSFAVAMQRHAGQQIQKSFAGELSPEMMNPWVAFMMQFRQYPIQAAEKQQGRNLMFADKEAAMGIALNGASSAGARILRYYSLAQALPEDKREAYLSRRFKNDFAHDSLSYMGIVGHMMGTYDIADSVLDRNQSIADQLPVINWADSYIKAAKSTMKFDALNERDLANIQKAAPLGTIAQVNIIAGWLKGQMAEDAEPVRSTRTHLQRN